MDGVAIECLVMDVMGSVAGHLPVCNIMAINAHDNEWCVSFIHSFIY